MGSYTPSAIECDLLVTNGVIVSSSDLIYPPASDIAVKDGKILCIGALHNVFSAKRVIDAKGAYVTPGGVDTHVHLDQHINGALGDNFENGTRSAIAGGTTTVVTFAFQSKTDESVLPVVEAYHKKAAGLSHCDYGFHMILTNPTAPIVEQELPLLVEQGITSVKLYMTYNPLKLADRQILNIMLATRALGMTTMIHAENSDMIDLIIEQLYEQKLGDPYYHAVSRPKVAEDEATYRAISLAQLMDTPILLVHISSAVAAKHIRDAQTKLLPIHAETCPQYLYLLKERLKGENFEGAKCVCSPPLRDSQADLDALWEGVANGTFTTVSSDHCPFSFNHPLGKQLGLKDGVSRFTDIPNGLPGVETRVPLIYKGAQEGRISVQKFVEVTSSNPARLYGLNTKGTLAAGYDADIVIWYPDSGSADSVAFGLTNDMLHHTCDYTPFEGVRFGNWPRYTISRGEVVWARDEGGVLGAKEHGRFVKRVKNGLRQPRGRFENEWIPQYKGRIPDVVANDATGKEKGSVSV